MISRCITELKQYNLHSIDLLSHTKILFLKYFLLIKKHCFHLFYIATSVSSPLHFLSTPSFSIPPPIPFLKWQAYCGLEQIIVHKVDLRVSSVVSIIQHEEQVPKSQLKSNDRSLSHCQQPFKETKLPIVTHIERAQVFPMEAPNCCSSVNEIP